MPSDPGALCRLDRTDHWLVGCTLSLRLLYLACRWRSRRCWCRHLRTDCYHPHLHNQMPDEEGRLLTARDRTVGAVPIVTGRVTSPRDPRFGELVGVVLEDRVFIVDEEVLRRRWQVQCPRQQCCQCAPRNRAGWAIPIVGWGLQPRVMPSAAIASMTPLLDVPVVIDERVPPGGRSNATTSPTKRRISANPLASTRTMIFRVASTPVVRTNSVRRPLNFREYERAARGRGIWETRCRESLWGPRAARAY